MRYFILILCLLFNSCDNSPTDGGGGATTTGGDSVDCSSFSDQIDCLDAECTWTMTADGNYCWDGDTTTGGEEEVPLVEDYFSCNTSANYAIYWFDEILLFSQEVDASDWVAAFNDEVCVGFLKMEDCIDETKCPVYAYGENPSNQELTEGYMLPGEFPSFKIYDASEHVYLDASPSQKFAWINLELSEFQADSLSAPGYTGRGSGGSGGR